MGHSDCPQLCEGKQPLTHTRDAPGCEGPVSHQTHLHPSPALAQPCDSQGKGAKLPRGAAASCSGEDVAPRGERGVADARWDGGKLNSQLCYRVLQDATDICRFAFANLRQVQVGTKSVSRMNRRLSHRSSVVFSMHPALGCLGKQLSSSESILHLSSRTPLKAWFYNLYTLFR